MKKLISIITPCYNEEGNVFNMYQAIVDIMSDLPQYEYEHIFIDNSSQDQTPAILRGIARQDKRVKVILNAKNFGPDRSGSYAFFQSSGDATICLACDFQDPPALIPQFIKLWEQGYKVAWGKKETSAESRLAFAIRTLYYKIIKSFSDVQQYEHVTGFGLYDRSVVDLMRSAEDPSPNFRNLIADYGIEIGFICYDQPARKAGKSSYNFFRYFDTAMRSLINTSRAPLRLATFAGFIMSIVSFLIALFYLVFKLVYWNSFNPGTAPVVIGLFFLGSVQLFYIGIIGEYIGEILTRVTKRPLVVEKERLNFEKQDQTDHAAEK